MGDSAHSARGLSAPPTLAHQISSAGANPPARQSPPCLFHFRGFHRFILGAAAGLWGPFDGILVVGTSESLAHKERPVLQEIGADLATGQGQGVEGVEVNGAHEGADDAAFVRGKNFRCGDRG